MQTVVTKEEALIVIADNVSRLMKQRGMSLRELARQSENEPMTISRLTRRLCMPTADALFRIAEVLQVQLDDLFKKK